MTLYQWPGSEPRWAENIPDEDRIPSDDCRHGKCWHTEDGDGEILDVYECNRCARENEGFDIGKGMAKGDR